MRIQNLSIFALSVSCLMLIVSACEQKQSAAAPPETADAPAEIFAEQKTDADWPLHGRTADEARFSPLTGINKNNAARLGLAWEYNDFLVRGRTHRGMEATPLVSERTIYLTGPWSIVYAIDAVTGEEKWVYDPDVDGAWARRACCDAVNRGVALKDGSIFVGTLDGFLISVNAETGEEQWKTDTLPDRSLPYTITGAPRIAGDLIIIGSGGAELGVRGYVSAYHAETGDLAWRFFTVPGAGPDEHPEVAQARSSWGSETRFDLGGGGTVWDSMTYDEETGLLFVGVGNGSPWPKWTRDPGGGDNLFLSSILAIDARSGRLAWHYQTTPGDSWDYTATQNIILANLNIDGASRKVLMQAPKNGFFYILDRETGELLSAKNYTPVTWAEEIDLETGRPVLSATAHYDKKDQIIWPGTPGGHNWQPMAFSKETGFIYIPVLEMPQKFSLQDNPALLPHTVNTKADVKAPPFPEDDEALPEHAPRPAMRSYLKAWDPVAQAEVWRSRDLGWWSGGALTTAGGLVFQGASDGVFRIFDAQTGKILHTIDTGTGIMAAPITYQIDGVQYVAVAGGYGGAQNARFLPGMAARDRENYERLLVFKLDGDAVEKPPQREPAPEHPLYTDETFAPEVIALGLQRYREYCGRCHAPMGAPNGYPNLWNLSSSTHEAFHQIVGDGVMSYAGMAGFNDALSTADIDAIQAFIIDSQRKMRNAEE